MKNPVKPLTHDQYKWSKRRPYFVLWRDAKKQLDKYLEMGSDDDTLPLTVVACMLSPKGDEGIKQWFFELCAACEHELLPYTGILEPEYEEYPINPVYPEIKGQRLKPGNGIESITIKVPDIKKWLQENGPWPLDPSIPLSQLWSNDDLITETARQEDQKLSFHALKKNYPNVGWRKAFENNNRNGLKACRVTGKGSRTVWKRKVESWMVEKGYLTDGPKTRKQKNALDLNTFLVEPK